MDQQQSTEEQLQTLVDEYWKTKEQLGESHPQVQHLVLRFRRLLKRYEQEEDERRRETQGRLRAERYSTAARAGSFE